MIEESGKKLPRRPRFALEGYPVKPKEVVLPIIRNRWRIFIIGTLLLLFLIPVGLVLRQPYYEVRGILLVEPETSFVAGEGVLRPQTTRFLNFHVKTQVERLESVSLIESALGKLTREQRVSLLGVDLPLAIAAEELQQRLEIDDVMGTYLIEIILKGGENEGLAPLVNSLMETFMEKNRSVETTRWDRQLAYLEGEEARVANEVSEKYRRLRELANLTASSSFVTAVNLPQYELQALYVQLADSFVGLAEAEMFYRRQLIEKSELENLPIEGAVGRMVEEDQGLYDTAFYTYREITRLKGLMQGMAETNPQKRYIEEQIESLDGYLKHLRTDTAQRVESIISTEREVALQESLIASRAAYESELQAYEDTVGHVDEVEAKAREVAVLITEGRQIESELTLLNPFLQDLRERVASLKASQVIPTQFEIDQYAKTPTQYAGSYLRRYVGLFIVLAYGGVIAWYVGTSLVDNRIREERDIVNALGFPPTWPIPQYVPGAYSEVPFTNVTLDEPGDFAARSIRSLAYRIHHEWTTFKSQVFLFTGVGGKVGTTEILLNASFPVARTGCRVLVVDCNDVKGSLVHLLDVEEGAHDLIGVVSGDVRLEDAIIHDERRGVDFLISHGYDSSQMDFSGLFTMLRWARESYDVILLDSPPFLWSDLTQLLVSRSDVSLLVVGGNRSVYRDVRSAAEQLGRLGSPVLAAILNWGQPFKRGAWSLAEEYMQMLRPLEAGA